jgi:hypothetical protein
MRFALLTSAMLMMAAPAFAEGGLWQWGQMDMSHMQMMSGGQLASHAGDFVYGPDGSIVGTLDAVHGRTAVLHVSAFSPLAASACISPRLMWSRWTASSSFMAPRSTAP